MASDCAPTSTVWLAAPIFNFRGRRRVLVYVDLEADTADFGEALGVGRNRVQSRSYRSEQIASAAVGSRSEVESLLFIKERHAGAGDDGAARVRQFAADGSEVGLG